MSNVLAACFLATGLCGFVAGCSDGPQQGKETFITDEELADVVEMGLNTHGVDNPTPNEWRRAVERLCSPATTVEELPELVRELGLVRPGMETEIVVSGVWPIWGAACPEKIEP